jgi:hypothetical protein
MDKGGEVQDGVPAAPAQPQEEDSRHRGTRTPQPKGERKGWYTNRSNVGVPRFHEVTRSLFFGVMQGAKKPVYFFYQKCNFNYLNLGLFKRHPSYRRTSSNSKNFTYELFSLFVGHFCPPGLRTRLQIQGPH